MRKVVGSLLVGSMLLGEPSIHAIHTAIAQNLPVASGAPNGAKTVAYELSIDQKSTPPLLQVRVTFDVPGKNSNKSSARANEVVSLQMPVWSPGDYSVQKFGQYVRDMVAYDVSAGVSEKADQKQIALTVTHANANTWTIDPHGATRISVTYRLPETPPGNFSENVELREKFAFVNGASALMYLVGHKEDRASLTAHLPQGWHAETPLPAGSHGVEGSTTFQTFEASDYDTLADSPLVMAAQDAMQIVSFTLDTYPKTTYRQVYFGEPKRVQSVPNVAGYTQMLEKVVRAETKLMGGPTGPIYDFFMEVGGRGGGLEHLNSCRVPIWPGASPVGFSPFVAHEFFHQWNVKRIRPRVLGPFDYIEPPHTRNLWFAEGVTDYYAWVAVRRAGLFTEQQFITHWRQSIARMQRNPARLRVSADQSSLSVWETTDSQGSNGLSYYEKGALVGLCLDLKIRHVTQNKRSLDDVMRELLARTAFPRPGYDEDELRTVINSVTGQDLTAFYNLLARSTQEMPFAECLGYAGLDINGGLLPNSTPEQATLRKAWAGD